MHTPPTRRSVSKTKLDPGDYSFSDDGRRSPPPALRNTTTSKAPVSSAASTILIVCLCIMVISFVIFSNVQNYLGAIVASGGILSVPESVSSGLDVFHRSKFTYEWLIEQQRALEINDRINNYVTNVPIKNISEPFSTESGVNIWDVFPSQVSCPDRQRIGNVGDGGKYICGLSWYKDKNKNVTSSSSKFEKNSCVIYSYGVSTDSSFERGLLKAIPGCVVHAFDPSIGGFIDNKVGKTKAITFHKSGLASVSGRTQQLSFVEHLFDSMHRLNHSFVDILKIDIEGGEWEVFEDLADILQSNTKRWKKFMKKHSKHINSSSALYYADALTLPFGQLLIELHYESVSRTTTFFRNMRKAGFVSFSREINLIPTLSGGKPMAAEYSFINPKTFFRTSDTRSGVCLPCLLQHQAPDAHAARVETADLLAVDSINSDSGSTVSKSHSLVVLPSSHVTPSWEEPIGAVIYFLTRVARLHRMAIVLLSLYDNFWVDYPYYPVVIFHDDMSKADEVHLQHYVPYMKLTFEKLKLEYPAPFAATLRSGQNPAPPARTRCSAHSSTIGYRHMCYFHATLVHSLMGPILARAHDELTGTDTHSRSSNSNVRPPLEYIMRLDDDSLITAAIGYDLFKYMKTNNKKYAFVSTVQDEDECVKGLWNHSKVVWNSYFNLSNTKESSVFNNTLHKQKAEQGSNRTIFAKSSHFRRHSNRNSTASSGLVGKMEDSFYLDWTEGLVFYNNFEISHVSIWKHPLWMKFINSMDTLHGIYYTRWGDAPIHTIGVSMVVPRRQIHPFTDIGYRHTPFADTVPSGLPPPDIDPFHSSNDCTYYNGWICGGNRLNRTNATDATYITTPSWAMEEPETLILDSLTLEEHNDFKDKATSNEEIDKENLLYKGVMYTAGHKGRERILSDTLVSMYNGYAASRRCPIVVFYFNMDISLVTAPLTPDQSSLITFVKISKVFSEQQMESELLEIRDSKQSWRNSTTCTVGYNTETVAASNFLVSHATKELIKLGYDWFFRFADDSMISAPIDHNIFMRMEEMGKKFGFLSVVQETEKCASSLWDISYEFCDSLAARRGRKLGVAAEDFSSVQCSSLLKAWPEGVVNFLLEVSHRSVWESEIWEAFLKHVIAINSIRLKSSGRSNALLDASKYGYGESMMHTICILLSLSLEEVYRFPDIRYSVILKGSNDITGKPLQINKVPVLSAPSLDRHFVPQRFGWLGGDVASSFSLPSVNCFRLKSSPSSGAGFRIVERLSSSCFASTLPCSNKTQSQLTDGGKEILGSKYIWVFGDSLIGTSSASKRLEAQLVSNTIAIAEMEYPSDSKLTSQASNPNLVAPSQCYNMKKMNFFWGSSMKANKQTSKVSDLAADNNHVLHQNVNNELPAAIFNASKIVVPCFEQCTSKAEKTSILNYIPEAVFWPLEGITVVSTDDSLDDLESDQTDVPIISAKAFVLGQVVSVPKRSDPATDPSASGSQYKIQRDFFVDDSAGFLFQEHFTAVFVIDNPHDAPNMWHYEASPLVISSSVNAVIRSKDYKKNHDWYRWIAMASADGKSYALGKDSFIYLLGSFHRPSTHSFDFFAESSTSSLVVGRIRTGDLLAMRFNHVELLSVSSSPQAAPTLSPMWNVLKPIPEKASTGDNTGHQLPYSIIPQAPLEASLHFDKLSRKWLITSLDMVTSTFSLCSSAEVEGPWKCQHVASESSKDTIIGAEHYTYAGKSHPELLDTSISPAACSYDSKDTVLALSYLTHSFQGPAALMRRGNYHTYVPKFLHAVVQL